MNAGKLAMDDFIVIGQGYDGRPIRVGDISTIEVDGNSLTVRSNGAEPCETYGSLARCKERLPATFFAVGRNCIVNLAAVAKVNMATRTFVLTMKDGMVVAVSRKQSLALRRGFAL